ncbi:hypothetical protein MTAT_05310 [Moorella thermoacetica]|uniref:Uncharacterized protein n=1 Tax=Neomoorella thermoacetica TaxID=1525 RepID=A0A1D7XAK3_NEOTH|nr:hypothetical protein Maut_01453 [Moorella thermoacetica]OIQ09359.1 hypothetical protein MOOR_11210 [Moorella thermoacetica]OIQ61798.1 hypothetical protein MTIN_10420 [Moorella thermoacetica]TYL14300.1 hypothetical protein MTAT_05310 [Moorella thermoacetica]
MIIKVLPLPEYYHGRGVFCPFRLFKLDAFPFLY